MPDRRTLLHQTADLAADFLEGLADAPGPRDREPRRPARGLRRCRCRPAARRPARSSIDLARIADPGLIASAGPRYFGFVIGGSLPSALAADWLTSAWDNNAGLYAIGRRPASVAEEVAGRLAHRPVRAAGRSRRSGSRPARRWPRSRAWPPAATASSSVLGWNVEEDGLDGAPEIAVVVGAEAHVTIHVSLQMLGLGRNRVHRVEADEQGRMRPDRLREVLAGLRDRPVIVCAQSGNVNTGAFDPLPEIVAAVRELPNAWLHVDGAFGLWAAVSPDAAPPRRRARRRRLVDDRRPQVAQRARTTRGSSIVRDAAAHHAAMTLGAAYYVETAGARARPVQLGRRVVAAGPRLPDLRRAAGAGPGRPGRDDRPRLRARPADGRRASRRARA